MAPQPLLLLSLQGPQCLFSLLGRSWAEPGKGVSAGHGIPGGAAQLPHLTHKFFCLPGMEEHPQDLPWLQGKLGWSCQAI